MCLPWFRRGDSSPKPSRTNGKPSKGSPKIFPQPLSSTQRKESSDRGFSKQPAKEGKQKPPSDKQGMPSYTETRCLALFKIYQDKEVSDEEVVTAEGLERLCDDCGFDMAGPKPLILAWLMRCKEMGRFTKEEWINHMGDWQLDTTAKTSLCINDLHDLLFSSSVACKGKTSNNSYNKKLYQQHTAHPKQTFKTFYGFIFEMAKPEGGRNIDMDMAIALWSVSLVPLYPICTPLIEFIEENKKTYRGVNKDLWAMTLEFCDEIKLDELDAYESEGSWPTMMDDFVAHKRDAR